MGRLGCSTDGSLNNSKFSEPIPWIGGYIAAASAACALAMAADVCHGFRNRKFWFPCRSFSLNATTLTLIAAAIKFSVDLNTSMPRRQDQLAKLSSGVFICTVMGNFMPSIGTMQNQEIFTNIIALGILVITVIINICIQLGTGVIFVFWKEHAFVMLLMLVLLAILISSALTVPTTKCYFDMKYEKKFRIAVKECSEKTDMPVIRKLREGLMKYWVMAHTCSPQFVMGRLATCAASGAFCLLGAVTLAEAMLRSYLMPESFKFCSGESDYKWSTTLVLLTQTIAVAVGTIGPAFRWFAAVKFRCPIRANKAAKRQFRMENYWTQKLAEWRECPLALRFGGRHQRKFAQKTKDRILDFCIGMQCAIVLISKLVQLISILVMSRFLICSLSCKRLWSLIKYNSSVSSNDAELESQPNPRQELSRFVLHLEGEEGIIHLMMERNCDATDHWFRMGQKQQPKHLLQLLEKHASLQEFKGVREFDSDQVRSLDSEEPPNCWALPVATLTSIAMALPGIDQSSIKELINSVYEGLVYVRIVENNLDGKRKFINLRKAAEIVWLGVDLYHRWLDVDLRKIAVDGKNPKKVLEVLTDIAKNRFNGFRERDMNPCLRESPSKWPIKVLAANSMYRACQTLLLDYESRDCESSQILFERLSAMISDILGACLTNLNCVISMQCHSGAIEEREESVRSATVLFGRTHDILRLLDQQKPLAGLDSDQLAFIDDWRVFGKQKDRLHSISSAGETDTVSSSSSDLYLTIE